MRQKDQKLRYSDVELSLIKNTFSGDDTYLYAVRKFMLGMELEEGEQKVISSFGEDMKKLLKKVFMPSIDGDSPLFQLVDMQMGLREEMKGLSYDEKLNLIEAKALEIAYINQRIDILNGLIPSGIISLVELADLTSDNVVVNITARNYLLSYIDSFCNELKVLAGQKEETVEDTLKRLQKASNK